MGACHFRLKQPHLKRHPPLQKPCGIPFVSKKLRGYDNRALQVLIPIDMCREQEPKVYHECNLLSLMVLVLKKNFF